MSSDTLESSRLRLSRQIKDACAAYGLYGNVIYHAPSPFTRTDEHNRNRMYIVAGPDPAFGEDPPPKWLDPEHIIRQNSRNNKLFYPGAWALELDTRTSELDILEQLMDYARRVEFLTYQYGQYGLPLPEKLRLSEVNHLISFYDNALWSGNDPKLQKKYQSTLDWFFKREKSHSALRRRWLSYYRSEKFPDGKGPFAKLRGYFRRNNPEVSMAQLLETNGDLRKLQMQEYEFRHFRDMIAQCYPEVSYAVGEREKIDHGLTPRAARHKTPVSNVTWEEYAAVRKERFADEGYAALQHLNPNYWDFRDIYYRAVDAPLIASVFHMMTLQYAKPDSLETLSQYGPTAVQVIPASNFMNFVSLAKSNGLRFYIDVHGDYTVPSFDSIPVLYNTCQEDKLQGIVSRLIHDRVAFSHTLDAHPPLENRIEHSAQLSQADTMQQTISRPLPDRDPSIK